jgi:hypothetical protein
MKANTPKRPWHSVPNWPDHVTGEGLDRILGAAVRHDFPVNILCWGNWTRALR